MKILLFCMLLGAVAAVNDNIANERKTCPQDLAPWLASLNTEQHFCGGSIINNLWVLTSGTCYKKKLQISLGDSNTVIDVIKAIKHGDFNAETLANNLMLVKLASPVPSDSYFKPVPLPSNCAAAGTSCMVSGWGSNTRSRSNGNNNLQCLKANILKDADCSDSYPGMNTNNMKCIGPPKGEKDVCMSDSGGPVECKGELQGVVSTGYDCANPDKPADFTRICKYLTWIKETIETN